MFSIFVLDTSLQYELKKKCPHILLATCRASINVRRSKRKRAFVSHLDSIVIALAILDTDAMTIAQHCIFSLLGNNHISNNLLALNMQFQEIF